MNKDIFVQLLGQRQFKAVRSILDVMNEVDIASLLSELDDKELALAFRLIPKDKAAEVFANMETSMQTYLVDMFSEKELKELLDDLYMDDTVDLLEELPANLVNRILDTVSPSDRTLINQLLNYPEDSAGSIMTTEYVDIRQSMTVAQSMAHIKETGIHKETIYTCYVTDKRKLIGIVSAKDLMTTDDGILISDCPRRVLRNLNLGDMNIAVEQVALVQRLLQSEHLLFYVARTQVLHKHTFHLYALFLQSARENHYANHSHGDGHHECIGEARKEVADVEHERRGDNQSHEDSDEKRHTVRAAVVPQCTELL